MLALCGPLKTPLIHASIHVTGATAGGNYTTWWYLSKAILVFPSADRELLCAPDNAEWHQRDVIYIVLTILQ